MLDLDPAIRHLRLRVQALDQAIAALRQLMADPSQVAAPKRRGRKSMGAEERKEVSERMRRYWAKRRREKAEKR